MITYLGGLAPYKQHRGHGIPVEPPGQCKVEQVQMIARHGERYPQKDRGEAYKKLYKRLSEKGPLVGELAFLNDYEFFIDNDQYLEKETTAGNSAGIYAGTTEAMRHGAQFRGQFKSVYNESRPLEVFTSNSGRVHQTAKYFARGFLGDEYRENDTVHWNVILEDGSMGANTLTPDNGCDYFMDEWNHTIAELFDSEYLEIAARRISEGNSHVNLSKTDVSDLFEWCAFETNVRGDSPVCRLFTNEEFIRYGYLQDLQWYYKYGPGNNATRALGAPFWRAALSHLKEDNPQNPLLLMFTHDSHYLLLHSALGVYFEHVPALPTDHVPFPNPYRHVDLVPMGARTYVERLACGDDRYVRLVVNDAVIPIDSCQSGPGFSCPLDEFAAYVQDRVEGMDYASVCHAKTGKLTFIWDYKDHSYDAPDIDA